MSKEKNKKLLYNLNERNFEIILAPIVNKNLKRLWLMRSWLVKNKLNDVEFQVELKNLNCGNLRCIYMNYFDHSSGEINC